MTRTIDGWLVNGDSATQGQLPYEEVRVEGSELVVETTGCVGLDNVQTTARIPLSVVRALLAVLPEANRETTSGAVVIGTANPVVAFTTPEDVTAAFGSEMRGPDGSPTNVSAAACNLLRAPKTPIAVVKVPETKGGDR